MLFRLLVGLVFLCLAPAGSPEAAPSSAVRVEGVSSSADFPDAAVAGAVTRVCAETVDGLREHFERRGAPFDRGLVRRRQGRACHVDYAPTLPGFVADPDDRPIRELFVNVDSLSFLGRRSQVFGDSLDISKALVERLPEGMSIRLRTLWALSEEGYEEAVAFHFGERAGQVDWRRSGVPSLGNPWTQDYLKSGRVAAEPRVLVTRRLFEGRRQDGELYRPMLDALTDERFARSRLSWEGGDLQFVRHPGDPSLLVRFFGDSARAYWGDQLSQEEYAYVLRREFGADLSVDLSGLAPHVDYFVAFLPADRIALVAQPMTGNRALAEAAAASLEERFQGRPPATLSELRERLARADSLSAGRGRTRKALNRARDEARKGWPRVEAPGLAERAAAYIAARCPQAPSECFEGRRFQSLLANDPTLLRDWAEAALRDRTESLMDLRLLSVVESQLDGEATPAQARIEAKVRELQELGFRVIRVPRYGGDLSLDVPWSGISYVNALLVDPLLFVPRFGLGDAEQRLLDDLGQSLPPRYQVVPVDARHMLLSGGGVHCSVAIIRD